MATHTITTDFISGMTLTANVDGHILTLDAAQEHGGNDKGPRPKPLMLTALAGCTALDVVALLNKMKVNFQHFGVDVSAALTEEHPKIYHQATITYRIQVSEDDKPKVEKAVNLSQEKYCGVNAMFKQFADVDYKIVFS